MSKEHIVAKVHAKVASAVYSTGLASSNLVIAVSGGADSITLLSSFVRLRDKLGLKLFGAHVRHNLYGESEEASNSVRQNFEKYGLAYEIGDLDVKGEQFRLKLSEEVAARRLRYAFLAEMAQRVGAKAVATGHTLDDQAETVLLNLIRGSGIGGISGMRVLRTGRLGQDIPEITIFRPLLGVTHSQTESYCLAEDLIFYQDPSNNRLNFNRNRVRHQLIPYLENFNPRIKFGLARLANLALTQEKFIEKESIKAQNTVIDYTPQGVILDRENFLNLDLALQQSLVRRAISDLSGDLTLIGEIHINQIIRAMHLKGKRSLDLPRGLKFQTTGSKGKIIYTNTST